MTAPARPSVRHRRLADALRALRTDQGLSRRQVAERTGIQTATLYRIETAGRRPQARTLNALLTLYEVTDDQRRTLARLRTEAKATTWLHAYTDVLCETTHMAIEFEDEARTLHCYSTLRVPDLLQTRAYAYAVGLGGLPVADQHAAERHVALQIQRQAALTRRYGPLRLRVVCDEAILHRLVGGSAVMRDQLRHLVELAALPNVTLRFIPFRAGAYPTTPGNFTVMDLPDGTTAVHVQDVATGDRVLTTTEDTHHYADLHTRLQQAALPPAESLELIAAHARPATAPKQTCPRDHWTAPA